MKKIVPESKIIMEEIIVKNIHRKSYGYCNVAVFLYESNDVYAYNRVHEFGDISKSCWVRKPFPVDSAFRGYRTPVSDNRRSDEIGNGHIPEQ